MTRKGWCLHLGNQSLWSLICLYTRATKHCPVWFYSTVTSAGHASSVKNS